MAAATEVALKAPPETPTAQRIAPSVPAALPPVPENPVKPAIDAPKIDAAAAPPLNPPTSAAAHTFIGPRVIHQVTPAVPRGVRPMITTDVHLEVEVAIDATGKVTNARVTSTTGTAAGLLTIEALKAAQLFRFQPAQENGRNVASVTVLTFRFDRLAK